MFLALSLPVALSGQRSRADSANAQATPRRASEIGAVGADGAEGFGASPRDNQDEEETEEFQDDDERFGIRTVPSGHDRDDLGNRRWRRPTDFADESDGELEDEPSRRRDRARTRQPSSDSSVGPQLSTSWWSKVKFFIFPPSPDLESIVPNYRITPIISGIVIPFSIVLEIPGLTEHWYNRTEANSVVQTKPNSPILELGLAVSMASGLAAAFFLILRFLEKRVKTMTIISVAFLTLHDVINITAIIVFGLMHNSEVGFTYGQAYWMTVCSTIASLFTNITLLYDLYSVPNFEKSGSGLTHKQRSLVVIVITLFCYIAIGALANSFISRLSFIDALYFSVVTIETIGFGDITPRSAGAKVWTCIYACLGILYLGLAVRMTRESVLEGLEVAYRRRIRAVRERRQQARRRRKVVEQWRQAVEWRLKSMGLPVWVNDEGRNGFRGLLDKMRVLGRTAFRKASWTGDGKHLHSHSGGLRLNLEELSPTQLEAAAMEVGVPLVELLPPDYDIHKRRCIRKRTESSIRRGGGEASRAASGTSGGPTLGAHAHQAGGGVTAFPDVPNLTHAKLGRMIAMLSQFALASALKPSTTDTTADDSQPERQQVCDVLSQHSVYTGAPTIPQFTLTAPPRLSGSSLNLAHGHETFRDNVHREESKAFYASLSVALGLFLVFWTIGSAIFSATEGWSYGTALYFCVMAFTTIGFGDFAPITPAGRSVFVVWALLGVGTMTMLISIISEASRTRYESIVQPQTLAKRLKKYRMRAMAMVDAVASRRAASPLGVPMSRHDTLGNESTMTRAISFRLPVTSLLRDHHPDTIREWSPSPGCSPRTPLSRSSTPNPVLDDVQPRTQTYLEALPHRVLQQTKVFQEHLQYFYKSGPASPQDRMFHHHEKENVPEWLEKLLEEISEGEVIGEKLKQAILHDGASRNTLFTLSIERCLTQMVESAEEAIALMAEREHVGHSPGREQNQQQVSHNTGDPIPRTSVVQS